MFGKLLGRSELWHLNRRSASRGCAIGAFWAMAPMPMQMVPAAACAIGLRGNIALAVGGVWLTNPLTWPPIIYLQYRLGLILLGRPAMEGLEFSVAGAMRVFETAFTPLLVGALISGAAAAPLVWLIVDRLWRWNVVRRWRTRKSLLRLPRLTPPNLNVLRGKNSNADSSTGGA
jgi:uncharacterized protein (DUF2062 family)